MPTVVSLSNKTMEVVGESCVGCRLCQIACSFVKFGEFNSAHAYIDVEPERARPGHWRTEFTEQCDACGYCHAFCQYGAIKLVRRRAAGASSRERS